MEIVDLLKAHGPSLTSEIIAKLRDNGVSDAAARQRVTRALPKLERLAGLRFSKNARFIYLEDQWGTAEFWIALERAFKAAGLSYWGAVVGLKARGGRCPIEMFPIVCGTPRARQRQLSPERVLERLKAINFLEEQKDPATNQSYVVFKAGHYHVDSIEKTRARLIAEGVALQAVRNWARKIGFGSYGAFKLRGDEQLPEVAGVAWDLSAPSYFRPLVSARTGAIKPGFLVCDLSLDGPTGVESVELFIRKHDIASAPTNVAPIMPLLIGHVFSQDAFDNAKRSGILACTIEDLFGRDIAKALEDLIQLLSDAGATAAVNSEYLERVLTALTKIEGAEKNVRSALFELVVGSLVKEVHGGYLATGVRMNDKVTHEQAEIDVLLHDDKKETLLIIECKAKSPGSYVSETEVRRWYENRIPLLQRILRQNPRYTNSTMRFELWTNGTLAHSAATWLDAMPYDFDTHSIGRVEGQQMKVVAAQAPAESRTLKILNEHYFKHPLAKAQKAKGNSNANKTTSIPKDTEG